MARLSVKKRVCRFLFGWCIGRYWADKNDRLACVFIAYMMNDWEISETMLARKRELWAKCEWWGVAKQIP